ncbi:MAG TPA: 7TM domain-containing protein, partial [Patescibacteria group bacterium]|nr:7TM domain-containing protein [Patescibacteria group bacterium]
VSFLVTGLKYGLTLFIVTLLVGTLGRLLARKVRLAYLPRMAIVLTLVSFAIFSFFMVGTFFGKSGLIEISIFPILVMVLLTEKFITVQIERGSKAAVIIVVETLLLSIVCYWLASWQSLKILILGYPEFVLLTVVFNYLIGRWPGLRLTEYYRFRKVIKNVELSEEK